MLLSIENLYVSYGPIEALHGITFQVKEGEIVTLIGANGAGKSTTLMSIMRLPPPEAPAYRSGRMIFQGQDLSRFSPHHVVSRLGISLVPEGRRIFGNLTVWENLKLATYSQEDSQKIQQKAKWIFGLFPRLEERRNQGGDTLSGGEQQMLAVARAMMTGGTMILLDEPSMGLAPFLMYELFRVLKEINQQGTTILLVEQNARIALKYAHRGYVLETGSIVLEGPAGDLSQKEKIKKAYLGE
ncbi:MAG TPA: ABC transporter ATP-binding protein [Thermodesulfobacteriota bacterium]|nr:ABC transporter ATP-binding protein [Thermodesulfobacteriota bacterium]